MSDEENVTLDDLHQWLQVTFYAQVPIGQVTTDVDLAETAGNLMRVFGFTTISGLTIIAVPRTPDYYYKHIQ